MTEGWDYFGSKILPKDSFFVPLGNLCEGWGDFQRKSGLFGFELIPFSQLN